MSSACIRFFDNFYIMSHEHIPFIVITEKKLLRFYKIYFEVESEHRLAITLICKHSSQNKIYSQKQR